MADWTTSCCLTASQAPPGRDRSAVLNRQEEPVSRLGADPRQLRLTAARMEAEGDQLESAFRALSGRLESAWWQGTDATGFRERWRQQHEARLRAVIAELRNAAQQLRENALIQERTSSS